MASYPDNWVDDGNIWCYYNITTTESATTLGTNINRASAMWVDGEPVTPANSYTFDTIGEHLVKFTPAQWGRYYFSNSKALVRCYLPTSITYIDDNSFSSCENLTLLNFNSLSITRLGQQAFMNCYNLVMDNLSLPLLDTLGGNALSGCRKLTSVANLGSITSIEAYFFNGCTSLASIVLPATLTSLGNYLFPNSLNTVTSLAETPPTLGSGVFSRAPTAIYVLPSSVQAYKEATGWSSYANKIYPLWEEKPININHLSLGDFRRRIMIGISNPIIPNYFYVQDESGLGGQIWFPGRNTPTINLIECSTDLENWTSYPSISTSTKITLPAGGRVYFRGTNTGIATSNNSWRWLQCDVAHSVGGRLEYLLDKSGHPETVSQYAFKSFFSFYNADNTTLVDASKLTLKILGSATEFYRSMFERCTALTKGPFIDMDYIPTRACQQLFYNCSSLQEVKCTATNISGSYTTTSWMQGVAATGTFYKAATMTSWPRNGNGIPSGWTVVDL